MSGAAAAPPRHVYTTAIPSLRETCGPALLDVSNLRGYTVSIKEGEDIQPLHAIEAEHAASAISKLHALNLVEDNVLNAAQNRAQAIRNIHCAKQYPSPENNSLLDTFSKMLETFKAEIIQQHRIEITNTKNELMGTLTQVQQRLGGVETRLGSVETRLESVETRLESVETRLESVEERLGGVENRLSTIEKKFDRIPIHRKYENHSAKSRSWVEKRVL
ncbi:hypothetical protein AMATHDRAFT_63225 [Amanita thiersii Skay4041]|uniref:Uncharacterized protein n=1 Tax=Amanita thiersii Skay4041 TaxID=703135 RepID=A0A2A9NNV4_9AGAR|nr:hypothetical protein AMATHDRAFT_63225 [Amanita thiersii Skay4041]